MSSSPESSASSPVANGGATEEQQRERNQGEIWSTRVQRELLALTTDDAEASSEQSRAMLPPFVTLREHHLDIATAICTVDFVVEVATKGQTDSNDNGDSPFVRIVIRLDASLPKKPDGSILVGAPSYPFTGPTATLLEGQESFPDGSTLHVGDAVGMDLDWTPSLHMADAIMNIGLKVKESILQKEPLHAAPVKEIDPVDEVAKSARRIASSISNFGKSFASPPAKKSSPRSRKKKGKQRSITKTPDTIHIGDEINLLEEPWVDAHGVYACKAIRRPKFIAKAMAIAEENEEQKAFNSPSAMFRSFTKKAQSAIQETFLMITETHVIEMKSTKLNQTIAVVAFCISVDLMQKLKFRRGESVSLFFKSAPSDPLVYMCPDSGDVVHQIQAVLKRHGVKGKHTNAAAHKAISEAMHLVQSIQTKEMALKHDPSVERVNEIMDLYRQAAERFAGAGDMRHEEVVTHMRKFLASPLTASILDGSFQDSPGRFSSSPAGGPVPEGEVLERTPCQLEDDDGDHFDPDAATPTPKKRERNSTKDFEEKVDSLLKEAEADFEQFKNLDSDDTINTDGDSSGSGLADVTADLDAMMKQADAELAELMNS